MTKKNTTPQDYQKIDPDDFFNYEEGYVEKGGGGGSSSKKNHPKGAKTFRAMKKQQRERSREGYRNEIEASLKQVLRNFSTYDDPDQQLKHLNLYKIWIEDNLRSLSSLDDSAFEITFSKSGGPGGQNVNKRETKVTLLHKPTFMQVVNDQTRSQLKNKKLAGEILLRRLQDHIDDWREYLAPGQIVDLELVKTLLDKEG